MRSAKQTQEDISEELIEQFECGDDDEQSRDAERGISFWIPEELKERYDLIQRKSKGKFHKFIKSVLIKHIEKAKVG